MPLGKGLLAPQNNFLETIATRFDGTHANFVLGNAKGREYPIVYCSDGFCELTGVSRAHVMGRPCACPFLFGDETAADERRAIDDALRERTELQTKLVLYRADGTRFWCLLDIVPIKNDENQVVLFLVSQKDVTAELAASSTDVRLRLNSALKCLTSAATSIAADDARRSEHTNNSVSFKMADVLSDGDGDEDEAAESRAPSHITKTSQGSLWSALTLKRFSRSGRASDSDAAVGPSKDYLLNRRRSRAVLYHLSDQLLGAKTKNKPMNKLQSLVANQESVVTLPPQYKEEGVQNSHWIIPHYGIVRIAWDWLVLICTFYIAILVPYNFAFDDDEAENVFQLFYRGERSLCAPPALPVAASGVLVAATASSSIHAALAFPRAAPNASVGLGPGENASATADGGGGHMARFKNFELLRVLDVAVEGLFICDILLNFRTTFVSKGGHVIYDGRQIALNYLRGWFTLDLIAALPLEILSFVRNGLVGGNLLKLARMVRLARLLQKIDRYSQYSAVVLALLVSMFALSAHWLACIWYIVGRVELDLQPCNWTWGWIYELANRSGTPFGENRTGGPEPASRYITALYFTCTLLTSVGFALMHAVVFGNMSAIIQRMYSRRATYTTRSNDLKDFSQIHRLPRELKQRMLEFFQTMWSINHGIDPNEIMKEFPEELRGDMALHLYRELLATPLFEAASQGCLKKLAYQCVRYRFSTPGEYLLHRGDRIFCLYFICSGSLEILRNGLVVAILGKGDLFGADLQGSAVARLVGSRASNVFRYSFYIKEKLFLLKSACDVRALTYCDLNLVELEGLCHIMLHYPDFGDTLIEELQDELAFNLLDDESGSERHSRGSSGRASPTGLHRGRGRSGALDADADADADVDADADEDADSVLRGRRSSRVRRQMALGNEPIEEEEEEEELLDSENEYSDNAPEQQCGAGGAAEDPTTTSINQETAVAQLPSIAEREEQHEAHEQSESAPRLEDASANCSSALFHVLGSRAADGAGTPLAPLLLPAQSPHPLRSAKAPDEEQSHLAPPPRQRPFRRHETCPTFQSQWGGGGVDNNLSGQSPAPRYNKAHRQNSSRSMVGAHAIKRWRSLETSRMSKSTPRNSRDRLAGCRPPSPPRGSSAAGGGGGGAPADEDASPLARLISPQPRLPNALLQPPPSPARCSPAGSKSGSPNQSQVLRPSAIGDVRRELRALGDRVGAIDARLNDVLALLRQLHDMQQAAPVWPFALPSQPAAERASAAALVNGGGSGRLLSVDFSASQRMSRTPTDTSLSSATILYVDDEDVDDAPAASAPSALSSANT